MLKFMYNVFMYFYLKLKLKIIVDTYNQGRDDYKDFIVNNFSNFVDSILNEIVDVEVKKRVENIPDSILDKYIYNEYQGLKERYNLLKTDYNKVLEKMEESL